jgi:titin
MSFDAALLSANQLTGVPDAPRNLRIEDVKKTSVTLSWEAPLSDGGGEITGYFVEKQSSYSSRWVPLNRAPISVPTYTVRDVAEGEDCEFRVIAANEAGVGPASQSTGIVRPRDLVTKPSQPGPLAVELDAGRKAAELRWTKPKDDGRSPISNYVVEMRSNKAPRWKVCAAQTPTVVLKFRYLVQQRLVFISVYLDASLSPVNSQNCMLLHLIFALATYI